MNRLVALVLLVTLCVAGCSLTRAPRNAEPVNSDVVLAFGSDSCSICVRNKPRLAQLPVPVLYFDNITHGIPLPYYVLVRGGRIIAETNSLDELQSYL